VVLDLCQHALAGGAGDYRPLLYRPKSLLARCPRTAGGAEEATERLLLRDPAYPKDVVLHRPQGRDKRHGHSHARWSALFKGKNLGRNILASVPWFLQDLGTYGIGIFTPTILATVIGARIDHPRNTAELI
jgi:MFS transporter, putative metabolite transport protein